ncbi:MAG: hypothetical protein KDI08_04640, partial [Pseudomonadales bacterium]|nr:hypothetical protein [Pseudomonadales bacterium]
MHAEDHDETRPATAQDNAEGPLTESPGSVAHGGEVIKACLKVLPNAPGVYRMLGQGGDALYVGKARNLRKRVYSYT